LEKKHDKPFFQASGLSLVTQRFADRNHMNLVQAISAMGLIALPQLHAANPVNVAVSDEIPRRPNIVVILADDMGYGDVAVQNSNGRIPTLNLDRLATDGLTFTDAHSAGSYCVPSRYGLLTGRYMWRTRLGSGGNLANFAGTLIEPGRKTLADVLRDAGYFTGLIGKWHQGIDWKLRDESARGDIRVNPNYQDFENIDFASPVLKGPKDYGFDYSFGTAGSAEMNPSTFIENNQATVIPTLLSVEAKDKYGEWYGRDDNIIAEDYTMDRLVPTLSNKACQFVETAARTRPDQPFFLYYAMTTPHNPIVPNQEFVGTSRAGAYGDFVVELDHHVGRLMQTLAELGIEKNTIVIFTSDNGPVNRTRGYSAKWVRGDTAVHGHDSNGPFNGWKSGLQEGGHRVPFFVRWPETIKAGERCSTTILFNDVLPTLAEMLDVKLDNQTAEDGISFFKALTGESRPESFHDAIVHNQSTGTFAIRKGAFKLTVNGPKSAPQILDDAFPVSFVLHDLHNDIEETIDVSSKNPTLVNEMYALLKQYVREGRSVTLR
jgi:arylsulfatase A